MAIKQRNLSEMFDKALELAKNGDREGALEAFTALRQEIEDLRDEVQMEMLQYATPEGKPS